MSLVKTSLLNGIAVLVKMVSLFGLNKILAVYVGPSGYALIGQLQNALTVITTLSSGAVNSGVTKYTAEYADDLARQSKVWQSASALAIMGSLMIALLVAVFSHHLAIYFLHDSSLRGVFLWVAASLLFFTLNALLLAILNGRKEIGRFVLANIVGSVVSLVVTSLLAYVYGLYGALISIGISQAVIFFVTLFVCRRAEWFRPQWLIGSWDLEVLANLAKFAAMAITTAVCLPIAQVMIRNHLSHEYGVESAGYWEAIWRLSSAYLMMVTMTLSVYYLPRLSELKDSKAIFKEIRSGYLLILPLALVCSMLVYFMRDFIIQVLFTRDFLPMRDLFAWQLVGDVMKIGSWILAFVMLGKAMYKLYIVSEIAFAVLFYFMTIWFTQGDGLEGVVKAYAVNYLIYWVIVGGGVAFTLRRASQNEAVDEER
ncbi:O-antigen translocase [Pseudomonas monteilii]|uniref:O-antigen translocase n=1 Tax=Pseudomonas monteilii TaxID=76759 RepID=UPI0018A4C1B2|nr:O-antigen translocase [Pseudomonas monteilii]BBV98512.1 LPS biosynthesis protein [Pseudomonas monteilii]